MVVVVVVVLLGTPIRCIMLGVMAKLPGWVVDDVTPVRREVEHLVGTTPAERWQLAVQCSRDAMWAIRASPDPQRLLDWVDPLPPSTVAALARLRGVERARRRGR